MRILVTRALGDARETAAELARLDIEAVLAPMLSYRFADPEISPGGAAMRPAACLVTSRNGAEALARRITDRAVPVFAVGGATAARLHRLGFTDVSSADGDVTALVRLVRNRLAADAGPLLFPAAATVAGDLEGALGRHGYDVRRVVAYHSVPAAVLPVAAAAALRAGSLDGALFFSPKTGRTFAGLVRAAGLESACSALTACCLSAAVAGSVGTLPWAAIRIAPHPRQADLLALLAVPCHKDA